MLDLPGGLGWHLDAAIRTITIITTSTNILTVRRRIRITISITIRLQISHNNSNNSNSNIGGFKLFGLGLSQIGLGRCGLFG